MHIFWNGPDGLRDDRRQLLPARAVLCIATADFNNDGHLDIFAGSYHDGRERDVDSVIYWGGPGGRFSAADFMRLRTHSCSGCMAADFNGDGWIDLAVCNHKTFGDHRGESFVYWNGPDGFDERRPTRLPTVGAHGMMVVQPGNQADRGPEEYYTSEPFTLPPGARVRMISWDADLPPGAWVNAQLRFAATPDALPSSPWLGPAGPADWFANNAAVNLDPPPGPHLQYRLALGSTNSGTTARVREVRVGYA